MSRGATFTFEELQTAHRMYAEGLHPGDIAKALARPRASVESRLSYDRKRGLIPPKLQRGVFWSDNEEVRLRALIAKGASQNEIARVLNRTLSSVAGKIKNMDADHTIGRRVRVDESIPVVRAALADRDRRASLQRPTLTAEFFGDPLPGYSAWDQKQAGR